MSASLVGSEMCIRDRSWRTRIRLRRSQLELRGPRSGLKIDPPKLWRGAVSYTHLTLPTICSV
eukprot:5092144-Alexandrium_andersonii.AAC.1